MLKPIFNSRVPGWVGANAIVLYPFAFFARNYQDYLVSSSGRALLRHEAEHAYQIMALGPLKFYYQYAKEYIKGRLEGKSHFDAYLAISFEVYAREAERDPLTPEHLSILGID